MNLVLFICLIFTAHHTNGYKILVVYPLAIRSLNILGEGIVRHLLNSGHEVTYITAYPIKNRDDKNLRQIDISETIPYLLGSDMLSVAKIMENPSQFDDAQSMQDFVLYLATVAIKHEKVNAFLKETSVEFDAVIVDLFETEVYAGLAALYNCPMIWSFSLGVQPGVMRLIDETTNPAYCPDYMSTDVPPLSFIQRIQGLWTQLKREFTTSCMFSPKEEAVYKQLFQPYFKQRGKTLPAYEDLIYNASLILSNEYYTFGNIPSTPQNFKFIGGQHIETPTKPLPQDLQLLMDNAKNGVIYFSLGSTWKSKDIPKSVTTNLIKVFSELKQTVIWKYEADLEKLPENLHIIKWAPQQSILAHPNLLLFITHGGYLSSTEAVHFGVPVIGVPIFMDQFVNVNKAVKHGYALKADLSFNLADNIRAAIKTMLNDKSYKSKAKALSEVYHDRPVSPGAELVHWVQHVVRTRGAPHLRSPALHVPLYQKLYLDLVALVLVALIFLRSAFKRVLLRCFNKKRQTPKRALKKNN